MKRVLDHIRERNREFSCRPIFQWLADTAILPRERLRFAPYMAHFVFSFMDINRFILRDLKSSDGFQRLVNIHTNEDSHHWPWYLEDIRRMSLDRLLPFTDTLLFLWSDHGIKSRMITYEMAVLARNASPKQKVILVEVIESTGNVFLDHTARVCRELGEDGGHLYYGAHHLACESGHHMGTKDIEEFLHGITLEPSEVTEGNALVDATYALYGDFVDEMHRFALAHPLDELLGARGLPTGIHVEEVPENIPE